MDSNRDIITRHDDRHHPVLRLVTYHVAPTPARHPRPPTSSVHTECCTREDAERLCYIECCVK